MSAESERQRLLGLHEELVRLRGELFDAEETAGDRLAGAGLVERGSARNLLHFLALRRRDIRPLQHGRTALLRRLRAWEEGPAPAGAGAGSRVHG